MKTKERIKVIYFWSDKEYVIDRISSSYDVYVGDWSVLKEISYDEDSKLYYFYAEYRNNDRTVYVDGYNLKVKDTNNDSDFLNDDFFDNESKEYRNLKNEEVRSNVNKGFNTGKKINWDIIEDMQSINSFELGNEIERILGDLMYL